MSRHEMPSTAEVRESLRWLHNMRNVDRAGPHARRILRYCEDLVASWDEMRAELEQSRVERDAAVASERRQRELSARMVAVSAAAVVEAEAELVTVWLDPPSPRPREASVAGRMIRAAQALNPVREATG